MFGRSDTALTVGRIAGAPVRVGPGAALLAAFFSFELGNRWTAIVPASLAWAAAVGVGIGLLASILFHEAGHALVARRRGVDVVEIRLWLLGGSAAMRRNIPDPRSEILISGAGPAVTLVLGGVLLTASQALSNGWVVVTTTPTLLVLIEALRWLGVLNLVLGVFNLLPALPLDGGRVLSGVLWAHSGDRVRALRRTVVVSRTLAYAGFALAFVDLSYRGGVSGIWTAIIAMMLLRGGDAELAAAEMTQRANGWTVAQVAREQPPTIHQDANTATARAMLPSPGPWRWAIVVDDDEVARGLLDLTLLDRWADRDGTNPVHTIMVPVDQHRAAFADERLGDVLNRHTWPPFVVIDDRWRPVGLVESIDRLPAPAAV